MGDYKKSQHLNAEHEKMLDKIDALEKFEKIYPLLDYLEDMVVTGNIDGALRKSAPAALVRLVDLLKHGKSDKIKLEAAKDILFMAGYKPVDRKVSVHADMDRMSEGELDALIASTLGSLSDKDKESIVELGKANKEKGKVRAKKGTAQTSSGEEESKGK